MIIQAEYLCLKQAFPMKKNRLSKKNVGWKSGVGRVVTHDEYYHKLPDNSILDEAMYCWNSLSNARADRRRNREYLYGNQWGDRIYDKKSKKWVTEEYYIRRNGKVPLKNNVIRPLVKTVIGQHRGQNTEPVCSVRDRNEQSLGEMMTFAMQYCYQINEMDELDSRILEEFLISGISCSKTRFGWRDGVDKRDAWVDFVVPNRLFFDNTMKDPRHWDCQIIGEIHDLKLAEVIAQFGNGAKSEKHLREIYGEYMDQYIYSVRQNLDSRENDALSFYTPSNGLCRVVEVWRKESKKRIRCHDWLEGEYFKEELSYINYINQENANRILEAAKFGIPESEVSIIEYEVFTDRYWAYYFLTPTGYILKSGESPFWHKEHPYAIKIYPFIDGEVHSFVGDVIDQQRYINRLISMIDFIMGSSAKGVLIVPEDSIPEDSSIEEIADQWTRFDGVIALKMKPGVPIPQQMSTNATNVGAYDLLNLQMRLIDDISGVHGALQGRSTNSGTPSSLYAQQAMNSSINLVDLLSSFKHFRIMRDNKLMKLIQQYYEENRYLNITGYNVKGIEFNAKSVKNTEFDLTISQSNSSAGMQAMSNQILLDLFKSNAIDIKMLLENGNFPFADKILQSIEAREKEMEDRQRELNYVAQAGQRQQIIDPSIQRANQEIQLQDERIQDNN